jgi:hypothetical protein
VRGRQHGDKLRPDVHIVQRYRCGWNRVLLRGRRFGRPQAVLLLSRLLLERHGLPVRGVH